MPGFLKLLLLFLYAEFLRQELVYLLGATFAVVFNHTSLEVRSSSFCFPLFLLCISSGHGSANARISVRLD